MRRFLTISLIVMLSLVFSQEASAQFNYYEGIINNTLPTFNRPNDLTQLSDIYAPYHVQKMTVTCPGTYRLTSYQSFFDGVIFIYKGGFNPNQPLNNLIAFDDDTPPGVVGKSETEVTLIPGVDYFFVTSSFSAGEAGDFQNTAKRLTPDPSCKINFSPYLLPIELTSFDVRAQGSVVVLDWITALEVNNKGFEVQHAQEQSNQDLTFEKLDFIAGNGTTEEAKTYNYKVGNLEAGRHYFRLKQIDYDGTFSISDVQAVELDRKLGSTVTIFPNPVNAASVLTISSTQKGKVTADVIAINGQQITRLFDATMEAGDIQEVSLTDAYHKLPYHGVYFIVLKGEGLNEVIRFVH